MSALQMGYVPAPGLDSSQNMVVFGFWWKWLIEVNRGAQWKNYKKKHGIWSATQSTALRKNSSLSMASNLHAVKKTNNQNQAVIYPLAKDTIATRDRATPQFRLY